MPDSGRKASSRACWEKGPGRVRTQAVAAGTTGMDTGSLGSWAAECPRVSPYRGGRLPGPTLSTAPRRKGVCAKRGKLRTALFLPKPHCKV